LPCGAAPRRPCLRAGTRRSRGGMGKGPPVGRAAARRFHVAPWHARGDGDRGGRKLQVAWGGDACRTRAPSLGTDGGTRGVCTKSVRGRGRLARSASPFQRACGGGTSAHVGGWSRLR